MTILYAFLWFAGISLVLGAMLAIASIVFEVKVDPKIPEVTEALPGANCGGCGFAGCSACAEAIVKGEAKVTACPVGGQAAADKIAAIMGVKAGEIVRMRAQVMCSGTKDNAKQKYIYEGPHDCAAAMRLGGGPKTCPNGCIGFGTCEMLCPNDAIHVENGVAVVIAEKCIGCGGGGIIPDVFVPMDTTKATTFHVQCNRKATMMRFAQSMLDKYRASLSEIDDFNELELYLDRLDLGSQFLEYASRVDGIKPKEGEWEESEPYLMPQIKALVGRFSKLEDEAFYRFYLPIDDTIKAALKNSSKVW